jgi:hypothetical protein
LPGQADPVYPPGQFSPWNRASTRAAWLGADGSGGTQGEEAEPGYSALAISDPSADATTTQTWEAIDDGLLSDGWAPPRTERDWGSHTGETGPVRQRSADAQPPAAGQPASPARESRMGGRGARAARAAQAGPAPAAPAQAGPGPAKPEPAKPGPAEAEPAESIFSQAAEDRARPPDAWGARNAGGGRRSRAGAADRAAQTSRPPGKSGGTSKKHGAAKLGARHHVMMAALLLVPVLVVIMVAAGYVYFSHKPAPAAAGHPSAPRHAAALASPTPTLGPWKHIESRAQDPTPLNLSELFPAQFSNSGNAGVLTIDKASSNCSHEVFGSKLASAVKKADCTQVLRASYLSTDHKIMSTVGVLNLTDVAAAERAGKVSGASEFIKQLPAAHGPTKNLSKGTGIEEAEFKGHYLILIWTEFANLKPPHGKAQRTKLEAFSTDLIAGTANLSLTNRMVTGKP